MKKWLIGLTIALSTASCATNQQNGKLNDLEARIQVLELKQSETLKELQTIEQRLAQIKEEIPKLKVSTSNLYQELSQLENRVSYLENSLKENRDYTLKLNQSTKKEISRLKTGTDQKIDSLNKEITALKQTITHDRENQNQKILELEERIRLLEEKISKLRIPSVKIEKVKPEK